MQDSTAKYLSAAHKWLYRLTRGAIGRRLVDNDMLLLTVEGRRSGRPHTVPLLYLSDDAGDIYVVASWGGRPRHPEWYLNVLDEPNAEIQVGGDRIAATATVVAEPARSEWWDRAVAAYPGYAAYQSKTDRVIPIVRLRTKRSNE